MTLYKAVGIQDSVVYKVQWYTRCSGIQGAIGNTRSTGMTWAAKIQGSAGLQGSHKIVLF